MRFGVLTGGGDAPGLNHALRDGFAGGNAEDVLQVCLRVEPLPAPTDVAVAETPVFVLVGDQDPGHRVWKQVEALWRAFGVPLTVVYVPGGRHQWLLGKAQKDALLGWLGQIAAGELPGG